MLKKLIASLMMIAGIGQVGPSAGNASTIDPKKLLFTVSSISNDLAPTEPIAGKPSENETLIHEDDWCKMEFFPAAYRSELQGMFREYKAFEAKNRKTITIKGKQFAAWHMPYLRQVARTSLITDSDPLARLGIVIGAKSGPAPIIISSSNMAGRVKDGFTFSLGGGVVLYGYQKSGQIPLLGISLKKDFDREVLKKAFTHLNTAFGLILADWDWRVQNLILSPTPEGVWRP